MDILEAYAHLLIEELTKKITNCKSEHLGETSKDPQRFSSLLTVSPHTYELPDIYPFKHIRVPAEHFFKFDLQLSNKSDTPIVQTAITYANSLNAFIKEKPKQRSGRFNLLNRIFTDENPAVFTVCKGVIVSADDPLCHEHMGRKVYDAIVAYLITRQQLVEF